MDVRERIKELMEQRGWTDYKLTKESGLAQGTITNMFLRNNYPSIPTLEAICKGLGITMGQFFSEGEMVELTEDQKKLFDRWVFLSKEQKQLIYDMIKFMNISDE